MVQARGRVIEGRKLGRTIGFPTLNLADYEFDSSQPGFGVYGCEIEIKGDLYKGILHFGPKGPDMDVSKIYFEVHVFDFEGDVYGEVVRVKFEEFVREVRKFDDFNSLKRQIEEDCSVLR